MTDKTWISELGIHYKLGVDGLNLFLIALAALLFFASIAWAALREWERPHLFYLWFGLAESGVLGALMAQDLALFVIFFDVMLVPFLFLGGGWGDTPNRVASMVKLFIYTLVGSLLMLSGGDRDRRARRPATASPSTSSSWARTRGGCRPGSQEWIFLFFAAAFLVKMPAFPLHGWMPDGYKAMPLPVLAVFSGILSKVAAYGFLRVVLPVYPDASAHFQELMLLIALASILYGSALAFTTPDSRLILGYSSVAQLGFITLGIFSLQDTGAQGALLQAFNHGLVVAPAFFILALLAARAGGSEDIRDMGGIAFRAPVLATLFLIVALANLAMPGSSNFVGEFLILLGVFNAKIVIAIVAFIGVVLASVYTLRLFIRAMHNRVGPHVASREIGVRRRPGHRAARGWPSSPSRSIPQLALDRSETSVQGLDPGREGAEPMTRPRVRTSTGPGCRRCWRCWAPPRSCSCIGLLRPRAVREVLVPLLALAGFLAAIGLGIWQFGEPEGPHRRRPAPRRPDDRALVRVLRRRRGGRAAVVARAWPRARPRTASTSRCCSPRPRACGCSSPRRTWSRVFLGLELLSIPLYVLCATEMRRATSLESGLKYLIIGSVGSATLLYGLAFIYGATGSTDFSGIARAAGRPDRPTRCC